MDDNNLLNNRISVKKTADTAKRNKNMTLKPFSETFNITGKQWLMKLLFKNGYNEKHSSTTN